MAVASVDINRVARCTQVLVPRNGAKAIDRYHKWVEWNDEDGVYIGRCPDLITGIHGDDPVQVYEELCEVIAAVIDDFETRGQPLPDPRVRPVLQVK